VRLESDEVEEVESGEVESGEVESDEVEKVELVDLADEVDAEAVVRVLVHELESAGQIDAAGGDERVVRPQLHSPIPVGAREADALVDEACAEAGPSRLRVDEQDAELRGQVIGGDAEHASDAVAGRVLGDPRRAAVIAVAGIGVIRVVGDDAGDERLERHIPTELRRVQLAVRHHDPTEVAGLPEWPDVRLHAHQRDLPRSDCKALLKQSFQCQSSSMATAPRQPSARHDELLELAYEYVLDNGLDDMSLRPLAATIGTSPRVLLFLFGSKDGLVRAILARARQDELRLLDDVRARASGEGLDVTVRAIWTWLSGRRHRRLLALWVQAYARSLTEPAGPWSEFARSTVADWLDILAASQPAPDRDTEAGLAQRTLALSVLRGALLDLLATNDAARVSAALDSSFAAGLWGVSRPLDEFRRSGTGRS
jgi:AcrR family transcriptional regulator